MAGRDYSPHQQKIIKRYYDNFDGIQTRRLAELITEIYLAEGKKRDRLWKQVGELLLKLGLPENRVTPLLTLRDPARLPEILKELEQKAK